jgi:cytochrome P450
LAVSHHLYVACPLLAIDPATHIPISYHPTSLLAGGGARKCIGDQFAITEACVALVMLLRRFRFTLKDPKAVRSLLG